MKRHSNSQSTSSITQSRVPSITYNTRGLFVSDIAKLIIHILSTSEVILSAKFYIKVCQRQSFHQQKHVFTRFSNHDCERASHGGCRNAAGCVVLVRISTRRHPRFPCFSPGTCRQGELNPVTATPVHLAHTQQNWLSYVKLAIIALTFSAVSFAELQRLRESNRTLAVENEELRKQLEAEVKEREASERSDAKHINDLLKANDQVVELKRKNADVAETSRVQQVLLDQTKKDAEELKARREQCTVYVSRIKCYNQRAERMEKTVADYDKLENRHTAERAAWSKQQQETKQQLGDRTRECRKLAGKLDTSTLVQEVTKLEKLHRKAEAKVLHLEQKSREETKSGRQAEKELKSSETKIKSLQNQLATQKIENAQLYSLKFAKLQLEQDAMQAAAKITQLEENNRRLAARPNQHEELNKKVQELTAKVVAAEAKEALTKKESEEKLKAADDRCTQTENECERKIKGAQERCKAVAVKHVREARERATTTQTECDEKVKTAERNETKAKQDSLLELQKSRKLSKENEELRAQLQAKDNDDKPMEIESVDDDAKVEKYLASFGRKVIEVIGRAMAWGEMEFNPDVFLKALNEWRDCYQKHGPDSTTGNAGKASGENEGNDPGSEDVPMGGDTGKGEGGDGGDGGNGNDSDESEL